MTTQLTEEQFKSQVIDLAKLFKWRVHHDRPSLDPRAGGKWRTAIDGDKGFPDLVLARRGRVIFAELKSAMGRLSDDQQSWLQALDGEATSVEIFVWRPDQLEEIRETLR